MTTDLTSALLRDLKYLYEKIERNDDYNVILRVGQDNFKAHSVILKARSGYLRSLINSEYDAFNKRVHGKGTSTITLEIPRISPKIFEICLRYIYTGELFLQEHSNDFIFDLIVAADGLNLTDMVDYLQNHFIKQNPSWVEENLVRVYQTSLSRQNFTKLQNHCGKLIRQEPALIFNSNSFPTLKKAILLNLIERDDLPFKEINIWRNLVTWGVGQKPIINENINNWNPSDFVEFGNRIFDFIPYIRFFTISSDEYYNYVHPFKKVLPPILIEQLEEYYFVKGISSPPNALPPRRSNSKYKQRDRNTPSETIFVTPYNNNTLQRASTVSSTVSSTTSSKASSIASSMTSSQLNAFIDFNFDSVLINNMQIRRISRWIDGHDNVVERDGRLNQNFFLLARGSRDGMERKMFHFLCDNSGPTLILAKVDKTNDIIGGYNPESWSSSNQWIETAESFIFSFKSDGNREGIDDIILSRIKNTLSAIWDGDSKYDVGFSSDLQLFGGKYTCDNYEESILNYSEFKIIDYEVFQISELN